MYAPGDIPELPEDDAVLREIAAMDLALARRLYGEAMAEPEADKAAVAQPDAWLYPRMQLADDG